MLAKQLENKTSTCQQRNGQNKTKPKTKIQKEDRNKMEMKIKAHNITKPSHFDEKRANFGRSLMNINPFGQASQQMGKWSSRKRSEFI